MGSTYAHSIPSRVLRALTGASLAVALFGVPAPAHVRYGGDDETAVGAQAYGRPASRGNVVGVQPYMRARDYASEAAFVARLDRYMAAAARRRWLSPKSVVVFPEFVGFYLALSGEAPDVYRSPTLENAAAHMVAHHHGDVATDRATAQAEGATNAVAERRALLVLKAPGVARIYAHAFAGLARRYRVTIVAGSTVLPAPGVVNGRLGVDPRGDLYNVSAVFRPDGSLYPSLVRKSFPTREEFAQLGIARGQVADLPVFDTPAGRIGVLICADAWFPPAYAKLNERGANLIAVISKVGNEQEMGQRWAGYNVCPGVAAADDTDPGDIGGLCERQAWTKYAFPGRLCDPSKRASAARFGIAVFFRGELWGEHVAGERPRVVRHGKYVSSDIDGTAPEIVCCWL